MADITIVGPDNLPVSFPEGTTDEQMTMAMRKKFPKATVSSSTGGVPLPGGVAGKVSIPQTADQGLGFWRGVKIPLDNASTAVEYGLNKLGVPVSRINKFMGMKDAAQERADDIQYIKDQRIQGRSPGALGEIAGSTVANVPVMAMTRNPFIGGAIGGGLASEAPDAWGVATDIGAGAVLGKAGELGARATGALIAPQLGGPVNRLLSKGVRLTPGQMIGGNAKRLEDAGTSTLLPFVSSSQQRSFEDANKMVVNDVLKSINQKLPDGIPAGHEAINFAQGQFDRAYDKLKVNLNIKKDTQFDADQTSLRELVNELPPEYIARFDRHMARINKEFAVKGEMSGEPIHGISNTMTGHTLKDIEEELGKEVKKFGTGNTLPMDRAYADSIRELQAQLRDVAMRQNPHYAKELMAINDGYSKLARVESAAANTKDGIFTPAQFRNAVVQADTSVRHRMSAGGNARMQGLAKDMEEVLPRQLPDSGTAPRMLMNAGVTAALFGGAAAKHFGLDINPLYAAAGATALAPYTRVGGNIFRKIIKDRGPVALAGRRAIQKAAPLIGDVNAAERVRGRDDNLAGVQ